VFERERASKGERESWTLINTAFCVWWNKKVRTPADAEHFISFLLSLSQKSKILKQIKTLGVLSNKRDF